MTDRPGLDFSFSGLKTFAANTIRNNDDDDQTRADIARAFEDAVVDTLMIKCKRALDQTGFKRLVMAGGVSANRTLRAKLAEMMQKRGGEVFYARPEFCTDNGAMIAYAGMVRLKGGTRAELGVACVRAGRWRNCRRRSDAKGRYCWMPPGLFLFFLSFRLPHPFSGSSWPRHRR